MSKFHYVVGITGARVVWQERVGANEYSLNNNTAHTLSLNLNLEADRNPPNYEQQWNDWTLSFGEGSLRKLGKTQEADVAWEIWPGPRL